MLKVDEIYDKYCSHKKTPWGNGKTWKNISVMWRMLRRSIAHHLVVRDSGIKRDCCMTLGNMIRHFNNIC
jgi:hypothetical protein